MTIHLAMNFWCKNQGQKGFDPWSMAKFPNFRLCMDFQLLALPSGRSLEIHRWCQQGALWGSTIQFWHAASTIHDTMGPLILGSHPVETLDWWEIQLIKWIGTWQTQTTKLGEKFWVSTAYASQPSEALSVIGRNCKGTGAHPRPKVNSGPRCSELKTPQFHLIKQTFGSCPYSYYSSTHQILGILSHCHDQYLIAKGADRTCRGCT